MSTRLMKSGPETISNRRLSRSSSERMICSCHADDTPYEIIREPSLDYCQRSDNCYTIYPSVDRASLCLANPDATGFPLDDRSALYLSSPDDETRANASTRTKTGNSKPPRNNCELDQRSSRRSSVQSSRSRTNSCSRPTPLGRRQLGHQTFRSMRNAYASSLLLGV